jgi:hypothetical protein
MKRLIVLVAFIFMVASNAYSAWTVTASVDEISKWSNDMYTYRVKVTAVSDGSDVANFALSSYLSATGLNLIRGGMLQKVVTAPGAGATAPGTYTVVLTDELGASMPITVTTTSTTAAEDFYPTENVLMFDIYMDFPDIGDSGDIAYLYFYILH